jgi:hypothetical protein
MKKVLPALLFLLAGQQALAQQFNYTAKNEWSAKPAIHNLNGMFDTASAVGIYNNKSIDCKAEGDNFFMYTTNHLLVKVKNDKAIEMYNKIYVYMPPNAQLTALKARVILPNGNVIDIDSSKAKEITEEGNKYKLFAVDGVEKGSEVEYLYTLKRFMAAFGSEMFQSSSIPYLEENFSLATPKHLRYSVKGYNGFAVSPDSVIGERRYIVGTDKNVKVMEDEKYAFGDQFLKRVDYKLSYNMDRDSTARMYTWKEFAKKAYSNYTERTDKENKALDNMLKLAKAGDGSEASKILAVEDYIKNNINVDKDLIAEDASNIERSLKTKATDDQGIVRLFAGAFDKLGINYSIVFAPNRTSFSLDEDLENWNRADDILLYFPASKKYIAPGSIELRYPYVPAALTEGRGLFLKGTSIGTFKSAIGSFGKIDQEAYDQHAHDMEADISFNSDMDAVTIHSKQILKGYGASSYRPIYVFAPKDKQEEFSKEIVKSVGGNSIDITNILVENKDLKDCFENKPLVISADIKSSDLLENAGNKILFKLGDVIGPQEQMYQEKPRQLPVELPYAHVLVRKITLHIPIGYSVKNLEDINFNILQKTGDESNAGFVSSYKQNGNTVEVSINEFYKKIKYPLEEFNDFKKVINASADFNKVVLVLEKKS